MKPYADNVWLRLQPLDMKSDSQLVHLVEGERKRKGSRYATVIATGPGYKTRAGNFIANETRVGDTVIVDALAGQPWDWDFDPPRHNAKVEFEEYNGERGEHRVVREQEINCVARDGKPMPLYDRLVIRRSESVAASRGGIIIPDEAKPKAITGTVVAVGSGRVLDRGGRRALELREGDLVMFNKYSGTELKVGAEELLVLREDDVIGVVDGSAEAVAAE